MAFELVWKGFGRVRRGTEGVPKAGGCGVCGGRPGLKAKMTFFDVGES